MHVLPYLQNLPAGTQVILQRSACVNCDSGSIPQELKEFIGKMEVKKVQRSWCMLDKMAAMRRGRRYCLTLLSNRDAKLEDKSLSHKSKSYKLQSTMKYTSLCILRSPWQTLGALCMQMFVSPPPLQPVIHPHMVDPTGWSSW